MSSQTKYLALLNELRTRGPEDNLHLNSRVLVIDGLNTFIRSYAASPVTNSDGEHVGGISGTLLSIGHAIKNIAPTRVIMVFDGKNGSAKRRQIYPEYKANRKFKIRLNRSEVVDKQDNQLEQLIRVIQYLENLPITVVTAEATEADDVIAYIANDYLAQKEDSQVFIMSSDKDFYQLVNERIHIWSPTKKRFYYTEDVHTEYGIYPRNFALYRALLGDKSDNIGGVDGIGEKTVQSKFNLLTEDKQVSLDDLKQYAAAQPPKVKIYQKFLEAEQLIERNIQLMQLSESHINTTVKLRIIDTLEQEVPRCNKIAIHKMILEDKMSGAIKNPDTWLREVFQKLDGFALHSH
jgi:5'-3' exonuclease